MDYKRYHNEVLSMQRKMRDYLDLPTHSDARTLDSAFQKLEDNVQVQKSTHTIRDNLKQIESILNRLDESVMSHGHVDELENWVQGSLGKIR